MSSNTRGWYVIHVFSGYEQKIAKQIETLMRLNEVFSCSCFGVKVPMYKTEEIKKGKTKVVEHKLMPGYILVDLDLPLISEDAEKHKQIVGMLKSINGITGFVGLTTARSSQPTPLTSAEVDKIFQKTGEKEVEKPIYSTYDYNVGDAVTITSGSFSGFTGVVSEVMQTHGKLKVSVEVFGRPTLIEVDVTATEKK